MRHGTVLSRNRLTLDPLEHVEHHDTEQLNACPARKEQLSAQPAVNLGQPIPVILVYKLKLGRLCGAVCTRVPSRQSRCNRTTRATEAWSSSANTISSRVQVVGYARLHHAEHLAVSIRQTSQTPVNKARKAAVIQQQENK